MKKILIALALTLAAPFALAQATPAGLWKTIDDETKAEKSLVRITETGGIFSGKIEKITDPAKQAEKCDKCTDERKDKPILGMTILQGVTKNASEGYWDGGTILDPAKGKIYKVRLTPKDGGKTMEVRGFIAFLFRNQTWIRVE